MAQRLNLAASESARSLFRLRAIGGKDAPDRLHDAAMNLAKLRHVDGRHRLAVVAPVAADGLRVHPLGRIGIALDLQVLAKLLIPYGTALFEQSLHLPENQGVALHRGGVVGLFLPDALPDPLGLDGQRQAPDGPKVAQRPVEGLEDLLTAWSSACHFGQSTSG